MAINTLISIFYAALFISRALALQVSPDSPCAAVCLDDPKQNISDSNNSNTLRDDIVCFDDDYAKTTTGNKFKACSECLQSSAASAQRENDQSWFLYNLRYTLSDCLFDFTSSTNYTNSVCATTCGPLERALEMRLLRVEEQHTFSYCSVDDNAILGSYLSECIDCLRKTASEKFLANFLVAIQAGCLQRPLPSMLIGLEGNVFSADPVEIKYAGYTSEAKHEDSTHGGLSREAIIGIAAGLGVFAVIIAILIAYWLRRRLEKERLSRLKSPLDSRFGAKNITSPNSGAYCNPYASPPINIKDDYETSAKELSVFDRSSPRSQDLYIDMRSHTPNSPSYPGASIPLHHAYLSDPHMQAPVSPTTKIATTSTYTVPRRPLRKPSLKSFPPPITVYPVQHAPSQNLEEEEPSPEPAETSRVYNHGVYSQANQKSQTVSKVPTQHQRKASHASQSQLDPRPPSRAQSLAETWRRGTARMGIGNCNASTERPLRISAPIMQYSSRLDFELAEKERRERGGQVGNSAFFHSKKGLDVTPPSPESAEQWPGEY